MKHSKEIRSLVGLSGSPNGIKGFGQKQKTKRRKPNAKSVNAA